jgi:hypothetical protein
MRPDNSEEDRSGRWPALFCQMLFFLCTWSCFHICNASSFCQLMSISNLVWEYWIFVFPISCRPGTTPLITCTGREPAQRKVLFLLEHDLTFTYEQFPQILTLTSLSQLVVRTESKSVSLGLRRFEICRRRCVFPIGTHHVIHSWMISLEVHPTGLNQVVAATESKSVSLGVGSKPTGDIFCDVGDLLLR